MSCIAGKPNFRLLDVNVGWSASNSKHLDGLTDASGIYLGQLVPGALDPNQILPYLPPARLAKGCGACEWYLVTPAPPQSLVLRADNCHAGWQRLPHGSCVPELLRDPVAIAVCSDRLAIADRGANEVLVIARDGLRRIATIQLQAPGPLAFSPSGELLITCEQSTTVARYGPGGDRRNPVHAPLPAPGTVLSLAVDATGRIWVVQQLRGSWTLWSAGPGDDQFKPETIADLQLAFSFTGLITASAEGFCFDRDTSKGLDVETGFSWYGRQIASSTILPPPPPARQKLGQLLTLALDSGIPRCEWHRVRIDADVPAGSTLTMAVATTEDPTPDNQGDAPRDHAWKDFPAGVPHFSDWTSSPAGSVDFLINQPAGRYLFFRLRFTGNGTSTPLVRRVRIDFPRVTSLDRLPDVYRETPRAEDFSKRFLALFDSSIAGIDAVIQSYPALLDPSGVPSQLLPWLAGFFDIGLDAVWTDQQRRAILAAAPRLYQLRGTAAGLQLAVKLVFGVDVVLDELASAGQWGSVAADSCAPSLGRPARLGAVRLFSPTRTRFYLGRSKLGAAPLRSFGDPDQDPFAAGAFRFEVLSPLLSDNSPQQIQRLANLIKSQSPAHTVASLRVGGTGFLLGQWSAVGVDTAFLPVAAPVLGGSGNIRLNRMSVVWGSPGGAVRGTVVGGNSIVGMKL